MVGVETVTARGYPQYRGVTVGVNHVEVVGNGMLVVSRATALHHDDTPFRGGRVAEEAETVVGARPKASVKVFVYAAHDIGRQSLLCGIDRHNGSGLAVYGHNRSKKEWQKDGSHDGCGGFFKRQWGANMMDSQQFLFPTSYRHPIAYRVLPVKQGIDS